MNGSLVQAAPSQRPKNRGGGGGGGGGSDGTRTPRGGGYSRGRGRGAASKLLDQSDLSSILQNGDGLSSAADSSDELDAVRQERFNKTEPGNQYEQVHTPLPPSSTKLMSIAKDQPRS
jgi:hypothetical protein